MCCPKIGVSGKYREVLAYLSRDLIAETTAGTSVKGGNPELLIEESLETQCGQL